MHTDLSTWTPAERKKLQHMTQFHEEYQHVFGEKASICTIMKQRISHTNPPIPKSVCEEEMQNANVDTDEVIIEYMTDAHGNKIKKLKPLLIKSKPNREYTQHIPGNDDLPAVPKDNFTQKREITVDSYSESISSNDESSDDRTVTAESDSSTTSSFEETTCKWEDDSKGIEATLHQIASGLQNAVEGYLTLASHVSKVEPYELPQVIGQIPPPPMDVPCPLGKLYQWMEKTRLLIIYFMQNMNYIKLPGINCRKNIMLAGTRFILHSKEKEDPGGSQYRQKRKQMVKPETTAMTSHSETVND